MKWLRKLREWWMFGPTYRGRIILLPVAEEMGYSSMQLVGTDLQMKIVVHGAQLLEWKHQSSHYPELTAELHLYF